MKIIVDTNILVSTLIKSNGVVGNILLQKLQEHDKYSCYFLYVEVFDKKEKIKKASKLSDDELLNLLYTVIKEIDFINEDQIAKESWIKAKALTEDIDVKDVSFVALALHIDAYLWTGDKSLYNGLKTKGFDKVVLTDDLKKLLTERD